MFPLLRLKSLSLVLLAFCACAKDDPVRVTSMNGVDEPTPDAGSDLPEPDEDGDSDEQTPVDDCGSEERIDLEPRGVNVMIAVDGSHSMEAFWPGIQSAIEQLTAAHPTSEFGLHLFWSEPVQNVIEGITRLNFCGQTQNRVLDVAPNQAASLLPFMGTAPPGPGNLFFDFTPVVEPLDYYLTNATNLAREDTTNYLVFISDGNDNCFGTAFAGDGDKNLAYEKLAVELVKKNIRVLPIGFDASSNQLMPGGMVSTNYEALDTLARFGGTGLSEALAADNPAQLAQALDVVGKTLTPCRFRIPAVLDPNRNLNPFELSFEANGTELTRDRTEREGWNFVAGDTSEVELFGSACTMLRNGGTLSAKRGCVSNVCGQAASKVTTKPSAVLYLLDSSASMTGCSSDALFACVPPPLGAGALTFWGVATQAISASVVAPINDHVEFGLQEFPAIGSGFGACDVAPQPEVPPGNGTEISMIGKMLADLPTGSTPLVSALETVAATPGSLVRPELESAVIVVSDGGNSTLCGGASAADAVTRLSSAAASLSAQGVKTYAVRFGPRGADFAEQDAQLRAIVTSGGTATGDPLDPNNVPYLDAPDSATLSAALATISEGLSSCTLAVGEFEDDADKDQTNLYLNGEAVPFDATGQEGWSWADAERTELTLHGSHCTNFKTDRVTSVVIELGCEPIVLE